MTEMNASIITIGDELLIGQTIDTNSAYIAQALNRLGVWVRRRIAIADDRQAILNTLADEAQQSKVIILTGGLGPTADDITKPTLCDYFQTRLVVDEGALQNVKTIFENMGRPLTERNAKQAEVPESCTVLPNRRGTAPGMWFHKNNVVYVSLPGVPHEMKGLLVDSVLPKIKETFRFPAVVHRTLLTAGQGESAIADRLTHFEAALPAFIKLAYLPAFGTVRLRLTGRGNEAGVVTQEVQTSFEKLKSLVQEWLVADEDISLHEAVSRLLRNNNKTVGTAESCTGGYLAHLLTSLAGSSAIYNGSVVAYANAAKVNLLGVKPETLQIHGAVSEQTVREMAAGACRVLGTDYAVATSGIMGPDGGSTGKPVGTVWMAAASKEGRCSVQKSHFRFNRERNIEQAAHAALLLLRRVVLEDNGHQ